MHITFRGFRSYAIKNLFLGDHPHSEGIKNLGLAPGKERRTMGTGQNADLAGDGTDFRSSTAVDPDLIFSDQGTHCLFLNSIKNLADFGFLFWELLRQLLLNGIIDFGKHTFTGIFIYPLCRALLHRLTESITSFRADSSIQFRIRLRFNKRKFLFS